MKCEYCDNEVPAGSTRCPSCGAAVATPQNLVQVQPSAVPVQILSAQVPLNVQQNQQVYYPADQKSRVAYLLIAFFFGEFGFHDFYAGYIGRGIAQLLITVLSLGLLFWVSWIWAVVEMITVQKDAKGIPFK